MSKTKDLRDADVRRLIPGEPVAEFGGLTPEQFGNFASQLEGTAMAVCRSAGGVLTLYAHLAVRILMDVEEAAGPAAVEETLKQLNLSIRDDLDNQRKTRLLEREREAAALQHQPPETLQ